MFTMNRKPVVFLIIIVATPLALAACFSKYNAQSTTPKVPVATLVPMATIAPTSVWSGLLQLTPYPYATPVLAENAHPFENLSLSMDNAFGLSELDP